MNVSLISLYELGHQPFGIASPAAWLARAGASITCCDLAVEPLDEEAVRDSDLVAIYLPMHTATRLAVPLVARIRRLAPNAHLCCYGLYAPVNEGYLRSLGVDTILGGEFEAGLASLFLRLKTDGDVRAAQIEPALSLARQTFLTPARAGLPALDKYAFLRIGEERRTAGYTEASRGCKHLCRHCPIVPVYGGHFRIVQRDVVLADIRQQVAAGAQHITFGDPDFLNGPGHALTIVQALHAEFPTLTYDVIIKVEHLLQHARHLSTLRETGCLFVTTAVEAVDDTVLQILEKGHTRADFAQAIGLCRGAGLAVTPTFVAFNPWITLDGYLDLLHTIANLELIDNVAPVQYAIRLLIPAGSRLLELTEVQKLVDEFDQEALVYPWRHPDPRMDELQGEVLALVQRAEAHGDLRGETFTRVWRLAQAAAGESALSLPTYRPPARMLPHLSENWYC